ncbi:MAG: polymerase subunit gamma and tau, partial [Naasia sp.]|nr:polymerase subunit gamma and tau [Naasia sp.]
PETAAPPRAVPPPRTAAPMSEPGWDVVVPGSGGTKRTAEPAPADSDAPAAPESPALSTPASDIAAPADGEPEPVPGLPLDLQRVRDSWPEILEAVKRIKLAAWTVVFTASPLALRGDILTLGFVSENDVASFRQQQTTGEGVSEILRQAILDVLGVRVKFLARIDAPDHPPAPGGAPEAPAAPQPQRYGEAVVREILGASFLEETPLPPRTRE